MSVFEAADRQLDARRQRGKHPQGFEPGVKFDPAARPTEVTLPEVPKSDVHRDWQASIEDFLGQPLEAGARLRLTDAKFDPVAWTRTGQGDDATTRAVWRPKFVITYDSPVDVSFDPVATLRALRSNRKTPTPLYDGGTTHGLSWNDWQGGKAEGGGTPALFERFDAQIEAAKARAKELRRLGRDLGHLVILGGGDIVEGCAIYKNQSYNLDRDRRSQVNAMTTLVLDGLDRLAPLYERVTVLVVGGNHGENRIEGNRTTRADNDDCLVFENAARATERDPRLQHVSFVIAQDEPAKTLDVHGWILATTHGQAFGKGAGTPEVKAHNWFRGQAAGHLPAGDAHLLISHHFHHYAVRDWGACQWVQTPANDGGSPQHSDVTGETSLPGMLSWVMTPQRRYVDEAIL